MISYQLYHSLVEMFLSIFNFYATRYQDLKNIRLVNFSDWTSFLTNFNYAFWFLISFITFYFTLFVLIFFKEILSFFGNLFYKLFCFFRFLFKNTVVLFFSLTLGVLYRKLTSNSAQKSASLDAEKRLATLEASLHTLQKENQRLKNNNLYLQKNLSSKGR